MYDLGNPTDEFDVSDQGIVFTATKRNVGDPAKVGLSDIYYVPLDSFTEPAALAPVQIPLQVEASPGSASKNGYCSQPRFGPNGLIAFMRASVARPLDISIYIKHVESKNAIDVFTMVTGKKGNLTPSGFEFALDGHSLYVHAHDGGRTGLYKLELQPNAEPRTMVRNGSVSAYYPLRQDKGGINKLLVTSSSIVEPWIYQIVDADMGAEAQPCVVSRASQDINLGLSQKQVSEIYFEGGGDYVVQAWVVTPRDFDPVRKRYPLCLLVHGGPNGCWEDAWSTRVSLPPRYPGHEHMLRSRCSGILLCGRSRAISWSCRTSQAVRASDWTSMKVRGSRDFQRRVLTMAKA